MNTSKGTVLILFERSGVFANLYRQLGFNVVVVDIAKKVNPIDILKFDYKCLNNVVGVISHPPCDAFSKAGSQYWKEKDEDGTTKQRIDLVLKVLEIVDYFKPRFWFIENPNGRIQKLVPEIGVAKFKFHPWFYGHPYYKATILWGSFNLPLSLNPVFPGFGDWVGKYGGSSAKYLFNREKTFTGFAKAFVLVNQ